MAENQQNNSRVSIYSGNEIQAHVSGYIPKPEPVPYGADVKGVYFDGYPQIIKSEITAPAYNILVEKDVMVPMRDGVRIAIDIYHPDMEGEKFPVILCWGEWGKDSQDIVSWMKDTPQLYLDSPFWNGSIEGCDYTYTVPRGYIHVIAEPPRPGHFRGCQSGRLHPPRPPGHL